MFRRYVMPGLAPGISVLGAGLAARSPRLTTDAVIPGRSAGPSPESRDSGFDASHRPGM